MDISKVVGENLKRLRTERNYSLGQLAELCEVSKMMLSQIERGETNPTINTLWKIAGGLKVPYTALLEQRAPTAAVLRKESLPVLQNGERGEYRTFCYYKDTPERNFELFQVELDAGCENASVGHPEKSQEYIMVLAGELTLTVQHETYVLGPDDAICFSASEPHNYRSSGTEMLRMIVINYYPA